MDTVACWCCGDQTPPERVVHLGSHPEVAVCGGCAAYLHRRAKEQQPSTPATRRVRGAAGAVRRTVIERGWHERPVVGRALRWLDRRSPW
jgi:hypothetical protein